METIISDLRYGFRVLLKSRVFTAVAVISLALGIGANTAIFQLLDAVRLRSLPIKNPQELTEVRLTDRHNRSGNYSTSHPELTTAQWEQIRAQQSSFSGIFAWAEGDFNLAQGGQERNARGLFVSGDYFNVLGVSPMAGRVFTEADDRRGSGANNAVISYQFWQREFGSARNIIGKTVTLEGHPFEIIGVTPPGFFGLEIGHNFDVAIPISSEDIMNHDNNRLDKLHAWWLTVMGRLKPGVTLAQASAQMDALSPGIFQATLPPVYDAKRRESYLKFKLAAFPAASGSSNLREDYQDSLSILLGIAGLVLLIACANLANLMLARASSREREIAVRLSLGASRFRLIRQLLTESLLLAILGAILGGILAHSLSRFLVSFISTTGDTLFLDLSIDWRLLGFTAGLAVLTTLLFGLTPAFRATQMSPGAVLKSSGRGLTAAQGPFSLRRILVVAQVALSLTLLVGALLFVRTLRNIMNVNAGLKKDGILMAKVDISPLKLPRERRQDYKLDLLERIKSIPGVSSATEMSHIPLSGDGWNSEVSIDGANPAKIGEPYFNSITPGYFNTVGTPMLAGRDFNQSDTLSSQPVAIVNEAFAKELLDGKNPIGMHFSIVSDTSYPDTSFEIIGVAGNSKYEELRENFHSIAFLAESQDKAKRREYAKFLIASNLPADKLTNSVQQTLAEVSPQINVEFTKFKTQITERLLPEQLMATLSGFFGFLAVILAVVGLYGVISYMVARRRNEIGIRMALGADRLRIIRMIVGDAGILLAIGLGIGAILSCFLARFATSMLFGLKPSDPLTIAMAIVGLGGVGLLAGFIPARRASKQDPMEALRYE